MSDVAQAARPCAGCLGSGRCWVCLGTGYAVPESLTGICSRCQGTRRCHLCAGSAARGPGSATATTGPVGPRRVLVVDDETDILDLLGLWLQDDPRCAAVSTTTSAEEALLILAEEPVDVIVCDFQLVGASSDQYLPGFRSACPHARIVVHTADTTAAYAARVVERGADLVLEKGRSTLQHVVDVVLDPA